MLYQEQMGEDAWNRQQVLAYGATVSTVAGAGCTGDDPADDTETNHDVDVEYEISVEVKDIDLNQIHEYKLGFSVERVLEQEALLPGQTGTGLEIRVNDYYRKEVTDTGLSIDANKPPVIIASQTRFPPSTTASKI